MKKTIKFTTIILAICLLLLLLKNQYSWVLLQNSTYGMPALIKRGSIDNLYIGSPMFRQGIDIDILEQDSNADDYVLAYNGNQPVLEYYELKYLLDNDVHIQNLYIDMYAYSAWSTPDISDEKMFMEFGIAEKWIIWSLIKSDSFVSNLESFWRTWVNSNNDLIATWPVSSPIINSQFRNGGTLATTNAATLEELSNSPVIKIDDNMDPIQEGYIKEIISLAKANNINIYFLESPKYKSVADESGYLAAMRQYAQLLDDEQVSYILCENTWEFLGCPEKISYYLFDNGDESCYMDTLHLSSHGRARFTEAFMQSFRLQFFSH